MPRKGKSPPGRAKHGVHSFIKTGRLRNDIPGVALIRQRIRQESAALLKMYGDDPPFAILCKNQLYLDGIIELTVAAIGKDGVLSKGGDKEIQIRDVMKPLSAFMNSSRLNILALEKLRREGPGDETFDVVAYAEKRYPKKGNE